MTKYLVVCDLDDTLLTKEKTIRKKSIRFIKKFIKRGNYFVICTGRPLVGAKKYWDMLNIDMPIITDNGGTITYPSQNKEVTFPIDINEFKAFFEKTEKYIVSALCSGKDKLIMQNRKEIPEWLIHILPDTKVIEGSIIENLDFNPILPNIWVSNEGFLEFKTILDTYNDSIEYRYWGFHEEKHSFELFAKDTSKGSAMKYLAKKFGCTKTIAFGDQLNDLSMIEMADYGVVMINGISNLKEKAKYLTIKDNNHNGVIHFLKINKLY